MEPIRTVTEAAWLRAGKMNVFINLGSKSGVLKVSAAPNRWKRFPDTVYYVPLRIAGPRGMVQTFLQRQLLAQGQDANYAQSLSSQNLNDPNQTITLQNYQSSSQYANLSQIKVSKVENPWTLLHVFALINNLDNAMYVKRNTTKKGGIPTYATIGLVQTAKKVKGATSPGRKGKRGPKKTLREKIDVLLKGGPESFGKKSGKPKVIRVDKLDEQGGSYHTVDKTDKEETNWYHLRQLRLSAKTKQQLLHALAVAGYTEYNETVQRMPNLDTLGGIGIQQVLSPMRGGTAPVQSPVRTSLPIIAPQQQAPLVLQGTTPTIPVPNPGSRRSGGAQPQPTSPRTSLTTPATTIPGFGAFQQ